MEPFATFPSTFGDPPPPPDGGNGGGTAPPQGGYTQPTWIPGDVEDGGYYAFPNDWTTEQIEQWYTDNNLPVPYQYQTFPEAYYD